MGMENYIDSPSFLLLSIVLVQLRRTKDPREPRKDRLFRHFICASIIFHGISLATLLCTALSSPVPGYHYGIVDKNRRSSVSSLPAGQTFAIFPS